MSGNIETGQCWNTEFCVVIKQYFLEVVVPMSLLLRCEGRHERDEASVETLALPIPLGVVRGSERLADPVTRAKLLDLCCGEGSALI